MGAWEGCSKQGVHSVNGLGAGSTAARLWQSSDRLSLAGLLGAGAGAAGVREPFLLPAGMVR